MKHDLAAQGFLKSWGMILVSEIGDKTFFIAAVMAMKNPRTTVCHTLASALPCALDPVHQQRRLARCVGVCRRAGGACGYDHPISGHGLGGTKLGARPPAALLHTACRQAEKCLQLTVLPGTADIQAVHALCGNCALLLLRAADAVRRVHQRRGGAALNFVRSSAPPSQGGS
jgi:hypothetical protein